MRWSSAEGRQDLVARMFYAMPRAWNFYNTPEGPRAIDEMLSADLPQELRGGVLAILAWIAVPMSGGLNTMEQADEAIRLLGDEPSWGLWWALMARSQRVGIEAISTQNADRAEEALADAERCILVGQALSPSFEPTARWVLGNVLMMFLRHSEAAWAYGRSAQRELELAPDPSWARPGLSLATEGLNAARHILADAWPLELESVRRAALDRLRAARTRSLAFLLVLAESERFTEARAALRASVGELRSVSDALQIRVLFVYSGVFAAIQRDAERAARLLAAAMQPGVIVSAPGYALYRHWVPRVRETLGPERARQLRDEGRAMSLDQALAYALEDPDG
jgi:hypothetical protein